MGRPRGSRNKKAIVETKTTVKKEIEVKKLEQKEVFAVSIIEQPLLMCRQCKNGMYDKILITSLAKLH